MLKKRIMRQIRPNVGEMRAVGPIVWPAYAVAAACLLVALVTGIFNISMSSELRQIQLPLAQIGVHNSQTTRELTYERTALANLVSPDSQHFTVSPGQVVRHGDRLYLAMNALPAPPRGKDYQAWTLRAGAKLDVAVRDVRSKSQRGCGAAASRQCIENCRGRAECGTGRRQQTADEYTDVRLKLV